MAGTLFNLDIVNVQPMTGPTGLIYYLRYKYASKHQRPVSEKQDESLYKKPRPTYRELDDEWWSVESQWDTSK